MKKILFIIMMVMLFCKVEAQPNYDVDIDGLCFKLDLTTLTAKLVHVQSSVTDVIVPQNIIIGDRCIIVNSINLLFGSSYSYDYIRSIEIPNTVIDLILGYPHYSYEGYGEYMSRLPTISSIEIPNSVENLTICNIKGLSELVIPPTVKKVDHILILPSLMSLIVEDGPEDLIWGIYDTFNQNYGLYYGNSQFYKTNPNYVYIGRQLVPSTQSQLHYYFFGHPDRVFVRPESVDLGPTVTDLRGFNLWPEAVIIPNTVKIGCYGQDYHYTPKSVVFEDGFDGWESGTESGSVYHQTDSWGPTSNWYIGRSGVKIYKLEAEQLTIGPFLSSEQASTFFNKSGIDETGGNTYGRWVKGEGAFIKLFQSNPPQLIPVTAQGYELEYYFDNDTYINTPLYVPRGSKHLYEQAEHWKYFFNIIEFDWEAPEYAIEIVNNSVEMGMSFGAGVYHLGDTITLSATPSNGYSFQSWTEFGIEVSTDRTYTFVVDRDRTLTANFVIGSSVYINVNSNNYGFGTVEGAGDYSQGETVTLKAIPNNGYSFINWTENGLSVCTEPVYSFIAERDRNLIANFWGTGIGEIEESSKVFVFAKNRELFIEGADGLSEVTVYNVQGIIVYKGLRRRISLPCAGLYIVTIENRGMKVVVD